MPAHHAVFARARTRLVGVAVVVAFAGATAITPAPASASVDGRPQLRSPFACGQVWFARTYGGHPRFAIDWNLPGSGEADFGQPVLAGGNGVAVVDSDAGYGNSVTVDHGGGWRSLYAHLSTVEVVTGQPVLATTVVGRVGSTGRSDGSHLHHEQTLNGVRQALAVDGVVVVPSYSSRAASYQSGNCPPPPSQKSDGSARAMWGRCRPGSDRTWVFRCRPSQRRPLP